MCTNGSNPSFCWVLFKQNKRAADRESRQNQRGPHVSRIRLDWSYPTPTTHSMHHHHHIRHTTRTCLNTTNTACTTNSNTHTVRQKELKRIACTDTHTRARVPVLYNVDAPDAVSAGHLVKVEEKLQGLVLHSAVRLVCHLRNKKNTHTMIQVQNTIISSPGKYNIKVRSHILYHTVGSWASWGRGCRNK